VTFVVCYASRMLVADRAESAGDDRAPVPKTADVQIPAARAALMAGRPVYRYASL
jgi:hypothetical protein